MKGSYAILIAWLGLCAAVKALDNGLGITPPLGFNTWNYFGCNINETVIRVAADKLIALGLAEAGYTYLNIDDCWHTRSRSSDGQLQADPIKFPSGMVALGEEIHARGLMFGIYSDAGLFTCAGYPGSRFHEKDDAALFASWGVDYLKYDNCFAASLDVKVRYLAMRDALNATGRPIYFSMCEWGVNEPWKWAQDVGNSWRTDADITPTWDGILRSLDNGAAGLAEYAGPGGWNDPDMLEVGNGLLTAAQQRAHFALWSLVKAPLLIGANLDRLTPISLSILLAKEVIAINQDPLGLAGDIIWKEGPAEIWAGPLKHNSRAVVLFNRHHAGNPVDITVTWDLLGYKSTCQTLAMKDVNPEPQKDVNFKLENPIWRRLGFWIGRVGPQDDDDAKSPCKPFKAMVRDLYAEKDLGVFEGGFTASIQNYDVAVLKISPAVEPNRKSASQTSGSSILVLVRQLWCQIRQLLHVHEGSNCQVGCTQQQELGSDSSERDGEAETDWRPWHGPSAEKLQERLRAAGVASRQQMAGRVKLRRRDRQHVDMQ